MSRDRRFFIIGLIAALLVAVVVSQFASSGPDGLEYVAEQEKHHRTENGCQK